MFVCEDFLKILVLRNKDLFKLNFIKILRNLWENALMIQNKKNGPQPLFD